jgi:hypothetical protein
MRKSPETRKIRGVQERACGFVESGSEVSLAAIFYVRRLALAQAAHLWLSVDGQSFPIVLRPPARDLLATGGLGFSRGMATGRARLARKLGTLTAAHVAASNGARDGVRAGEQIGCPDCEAESPRHLVLQASDVMDAALVEDGDATGTETVVRATGEPGYFPVEMLDPHGNLVTGVVTEVPLPEGVVPGTPGSDPTSPAMLMLSFAGEEGWSGGMVKETLYRTYYGGDAPPRPYGMFVGIRALRTRMAGRMNMLRQLEQVWQIELIDDH